MFMYHMYFVRCRYRSNPSSIFRATVNGVVQAWSSWDGARIISRPAPCEVFPFWVSRSILSSLPFSGLRSITFVTALQTWEPRRASGGQWDSNSSGKDLDEWVASEAVPSPSYLCISLSNARSVGISKNRAQRPSWIQPTLWNLMSRRAPGLPDRAATRRRQAPWVCDFTMDLDPRTRHEMPDLQSVRDSRLCETKVSRGRAQHVERDEFGVAPDLSRCGAPLSSLLTACTDSGSQMWSGRLNNRWRPKTGGLSAFTGIIKRGGTTALRRSVRAMKLSTSCCTLHAAFSGWFRR